MRTRSGRGLGWMGWGRGLLERAQRRLFIGLVDGDCELRSTWVLFLVLVASVSCGGSLGFLSALVSPDRRDGVVLGGGSMKGYIPGS